MSAEHRALHVGVLGIHLLPVARAGMVGFAFTNSPAAIPAWGGSKALFGTDPVAAAFPRPDAEPLVIDLALTTVIRGKIMLAAQKGERIPEGWALDRHGKPTTDPKEAIEHGSMFPIGGVKGAMLALMFELICSRAHRGGDRPGGRFVFRRAGQPAARRAVVHRHRPGRARRAREVFRARRDRGAADAGRRRVRLPGARRFESQERARAEGIEVPDALLAKIAALATG